MHEGSPLCPICGCIVEELCTSDSEGNGLGGSRLLLMQLAFLRRFHKGSGIGKSEGHLIRIIDLLLCLCVFKQICRTLISIELGRKAFALGFQWRTSRPP